MDRVQKLEQGGIVIQEDGNPRRHHLWRRFNGAGHSLQKLEQKDKIGWNDYDQILIHSR